MPQESLGELRWVVIHMVKICRWVSLRDSRIPGGFLCRNQNLFQWTSLGKGHQVNLHATVTELPGIDARG